MTIAATTHGTQRHRLLKRGAKVNASIKLIHVKKVAWPLG
jgi:hypothetical protein